MENDIPSQKMLLAFILSWHRVIVIPVVIVIQLQVLMNLRV